MSQIKSFVKKNNWLSGFTHGWGNGYVVIPKNHPLHGVPYDELEERVQISVNGGLTFSEYADHLEWDELPGGSKGGWVIGFDTCHSWDTMDKWPKEKVQEEADKLKRQVEKYSGSMLSVIDNILLKIDNLKKEVEQIRTTL